MTFYFWRAAIISQGIAARLVSGQASSSAAQVFVSGIPILAESAKSEMDQLIEIQGPANRPIVMFGVNLKPEDDYTHRSRDEANNFNESVYCNFHSSNGKVGGFLRIGNRPNESFAEVTLCIFLLETNTTLFHFSRPKIASNNGWECILAGKGRASLKIKRPMEQILLGYQGKVFKFRKPWLLRDPEMLFRKQRHEVSTLDAKLNLQFKATGPVFGTGADDTKTKKEGQEFARSHYEQHGALEGSIETSEQIGTMEIKTHVAMNGFGLRDHSWVGYPCIVFSASDTNIDQGSSLLASHK